MENTVIKENIISIIKSNSADFKRFELLETFASYSENSKDIEFLLEILRKDRSSVIRHEAAAQLLKIEQKKPWVMSDMKDKVIAELLSVIINDKSLVARHESIEALSYIGDDTVLPLLNKIIKSEKSDNEILDTLKIAKDIIEYRIIKNISPSQLSKTIIEDLIN